MRRCDARRSEPADRGWDELGSALRGGAAGAALTPPGPPLPWRWLTGGGIHREAAAPRQSGALGEGQALPRTGFSPLSPRKLKEEASVRKRPRRGNPGPWGELGSPRSLAPPLLSPSDKGRYPLEIDWEAAAQRQPGGPGEGLALSRFMFSPSPAAAGEGENMNRGRAKPSPGPPGCRCAAAFQSLSNGYLPLSDCDVRGGEHESGEAKPSPDPRVAAARRRSDGSPLFSGGGRGGASRSGEGQVLYRAPLAP